MASLIDIKHSWWQKDSNRDMGLTMKTSKILSMYADWIKQYMA